MSTVEVAGESVTVIGVRFRRAGRLYYFDPLDIRFRVREYAIVETPRGLAAARVVVAPVEVPSGDLHSPLKPVVRRATEADLDRLATFRAQEPEAEETFQQKIEVYGLPIQPVRAEYSFDGGTLTLHFSSAEARIDLTELVQDLAVTFKTRVELRRVGPRERARLRSGLGRCGCELCCATFLTGLDTVTLRMAKDQSLPLNPDKISGVCGRLLCCLQYEHGTYLMPDVPPQEEAADGEGGTSPRCETCGVGERHDLLGEPVVPADETAEAPPDEGDVVATSTPKAAERKAGASRRRRRRRRRRSGA